MDTNLEKQKEELRKILDNLPTEKEREELTVKLLGEKYGESFEVLEVRPIKFPFTDFKLICYPVESPGLLFEVRLSPDGKSIREGYAVQKVCTRLAEKLREKVSDEECELYIRVESVKKEIPETDMPLDDFLNAYSTNRYRIVLFYTSTGQKEIPESVLKEMLEGEERLSGVIRAYCLPEKECSDPGGDDPCELFRRITFPVDEFFPPDTVSGINEYRDAVGSTVSDSKA